MGGTVDTFAPQNTKQKHIVMLMILYACMQTGFIDVNYDDNTQYLFHVSHNIFPRYTLKILINTLIPNFGSGHSLFSCKLQFGIVNLHERKTKWLQKDKCPGIEHWSNMMSHCFDNFNSIHVHVRNGQSRC